MKHNRFLFILLFTILLSEAAFSQMEFSPKQRYFNWPVSTIENGMMGVINPGNTYYNSTMQTQVYWSGLRGSSIDSYYRNTVMGFKGLAGSYFQEKTGSFNVSDYSLSFGGGSETFSMGTVYAWSSGDRAVFHRRTYVGTGFIWRPAKYLSLGGVYNEMVNGGNSNFLIEAGVRPFSSQKLTLFGSTNFQDNMKIKNYNWTFGGQVELFRGFKLQGMYSALHQFSLGFTLNLGGAGVSFFNRYDKDSDPLYYTTRVEVGKMHKSRINEWIVSNSKYKLELKGNVDYQRYIINWDNNIQFSSLLKTIRNATPAGIKLIELNISGFSASTEQLWEIRKELQKYKDAGGKVVIYLDNASMSLYHFASVADLLIMDPEGRLVLKGYAISKTYMKRLLNKLGLKFEEWRFFKYKSAAEVLAHEQMSEADREQLQKFLDDLYGSVTADICRSRNISQASLDSLINNRVLFLADEALNEKLVDRVARWKDVDGIVQGMTGDKSLPIMPAYVNNYMDLDENWGQENRVAVVYALGECSMDTGIRARHLEKVLLKLAADKKVKAVVLRVDSPGGDPLASDLVAEALKACKKNKPVVISQGVVAASGGYWLSMYGDVIYAGPATITGSIGVIGGWLYDTTFSDKMGLNYEVVKVGKHADFTAGPRLPLLGLQIPGRNLTKDEKQIMKSHILKMYRHFVVKVGQGRGLDTTYVNAHGQGRIYSGIEARQDRLIDKIGTLTDAIDEACRLAHLKKNDYEVEEYGTIKGLFPFPSPGLVNTWDKLGISRMDYYYLTYPVNYPMKPCIMINPAYMQLK